MIPVLYRPEETAFTSQGIGSLSDALSCIVTEERNGEFFLELTYPINGLHASEIAVGSLILAQTGSSSYQPFEVVELEKTIDGMISIRANHLSYRLSYIPVMPCTGTDVYEAFQAMKRASAETNPFDFQPRPGDLPFPTVTYKQVLPASFRSRLAGVQGSIIDLYGGEYEFDKWTVYLHRSRGRESDVLVVYGRNIIDFKQEESIADTITGIVPFWTDQDKTVVVTLPEQVVQSSYASHYAYHKTAVLDMSDEFEEQPTEAQLRAAAQSYIDRNKIGIPKVNFSISISPSDPERWYETIHLCDTVTVLFEKLSIKAKAKVVKTKYNTLLDRYEELEVGDLRETLTDAIKTIVKQEIKENK